MKGFGQNYILGYEIENNNLIIEYYNNKKMIKYSEDKEKEILLIMENQLKGINKYNKILNYTLILILLLTIFSIIGMIKLGFKIGMISILLFMIIAIFDSYISGIYDDLLKSLEFIENKNKL